MDKEQWHERYINRFKSKTNLNYKMLDAILEAGMDDYDYTETPEDAADSEMDCWNR